MLELRRRYGSSVPSGGGGRLPAGYQEVEYLESTGNGECIETAVPYDSTNDSYIIKCKFQVLEFVPFQHIFGASEGGSYDSVILACSQVMGYLGFFNVTTRTIQFSENDVDAGYSNSTLCTMQKDSLALGSTLINQNGDGTKGQQSINKINFSIFNSKKDYENTLKARFWEFSIYSQDTKVCDVIPCRRLSDNVKGMYDIVNDVFYTNAGTGEFLVGLDVNPVAKLPSEYQEVEYLENVEGAYIRTGITMRHNTLYSSEIDFQWSGKTSNGRMPCIDGFYSGTSAIPNWVSIYIENNSLFSFYKNTNNEIINITYNDNIVYDRHKIIFNSDTGSYIDGINISEDKLFTTSDYANDHAFLLFCRGAVDGTYPLELFLGKIYSAKYYENMVAIREFIPCYRKADNIVGMYDLVSGEFYTNAGTGTFEVGPLVI